MNNPIIGFGIVCFHCRHATPWNEWGKGVEDFYWWVCHCPKCSEEGDSLRTFEGRNMARYLLQVSDDDLTTERYTGF